MSDILIYKKRKVLIIQAVDKIALIVSCIFLKNNDSTDL